MVQRIKEFRKKISPAVLFLLETKNQDDALFRLFRNTELTNHFTVPPLAYQAASHYHGKMIFRLKFYSPLPILSILA